MIITTRTRSLLYLPTTHPNLIAAMDLAPPPVGELYVNHEELIAAANTWAEAHGYSLNIKRSSKNKRGVGVGVLEVGRGAEVEVVLEG